MEWLKEQYNKLTGHVDTSLAPVRDAVPTIATTQGSQTALGTAPETPGTTLTGGRKRKTRRHKKTKKTRKHRGH